MTSIFLSRKFFFLIKEYREDIDGFVDAKIIEIFFLGGISVIIDKKRKYICKDISVSIYDNFTMGGYNLYIPAEIYKKFICWDRECNLYFCVRDDK